ncbi:GAF domain-containing protein [Sphingobacterium siyangense]|uniref:GAF domain-containing protein n=1 Tax=Sphingobacterium siyangense TaxID=459529 RepID=UPI001965FBF5|nr:GAF domain-containing protein [Sphingobacterium siyangense]QRY58548.1 GAF domain-containing protein [Sphingobacterium siyangense]
MEIKKVQLTTAKMANTYANGRLDFEPFFKYLESFIENGTSSDDMIPLFALERIKEIEHLNGKLCKHNLNAYKDILQLIYSLSVSLIDTAPKRYWALTTALAEEAFYGTEAFFDLANHQLVEQEIQGKMRTGSLLTNQEKLFYTLIFERLYGFSSNENSSIVYHQLNDQGEILDYYDLDIDFKFVEIKAKKTLPTLDIGRLSENPSDSLFDWNTVINTVKLEDFELSGFSIVTFRKTSTEHTLRRIQSILLDLPTYNYHLFFADLEKIITPLLKGADTVFSLFPLFQLNGVPFFDYSITNKSILIAEAYTANKTFKINPELAGYLKHPHVIFYTNNATNGLRNTTSIFDERIGRSGVTTYLCIPLIHNHSLSGILEIYSHEQDQLDNETMQALSSLVPLLSQLSQDITLEFKKRIDDIIINRFTTIQPSVQWKFNHIAAQYIQELENDSRDAHIKAVVFEEVYPLYGAVDVKDSTIIRNASILKDFSFKVKQLAMLIDELSLDGKHKLIMTFSARVDQITESLDHISFDESMVKIIEFFRKDVQPFLEEARKQFPSKIEVIEHYAKHFFTNRETGEFYRNEFETSLRQINQLIGKELDHFNSFIQGNYPSYFQKFRTDGIEYDIYIGESITPQQPFSYEFINVFRRQQIISMARIALKAYHAKDILPLALETTQLIFINPHSIDISFREDERRFDVEGSLNIRYEIIKKRIDKIRIKRTKERLTQVNKIAIVYLSDEILEDLMLSIKAIYDMGIIEHTIEHLKLEDVQGIAGLKAIRLSVNLNYQDFS